MAAVVLEAKERTDRNIQQLDAFVYKEIFLESCMEKTLKTK